MNVRSGTILMYNCSGPEFSKLRQIFAMLRMRMHPVTPDRYHVSLIDLANGKGEPAETAPAPMEEAMLVFCGVRQPLLNQVLEVIRLAKLPPIPLKAVLTVGNQEWDSLKLREELLKEREAMEQAIYQILHTERFAWPIYSWNYGAELGRLTGRSVRVAQGELPRLLREALTQDARITGVRDVTVTQSGKREALVHFTAETVFGDVDAAAPLRLGTV